MSEEYIESNEFFFDYFRKRLCFVKDHCLERIDGFERIDGLILLSCYLDALGGYCFPKVTSNRKRFTRFILEHSTLAGDWTKISLPLLQLHFVKTEPDLAKYFERVFRGLRVTPQQFWNLKHNPDVDMETLERAAQGILITPFSPSLREKIERFQYVSILWSRHRNLAVHEARKSERTALNAADLSRPFYCRMQFWEGAGLGEPEIRFDIPNIFIHDTVSRCIDSFEEWANQRQLDVAKRKRDLLRDKDSDI